MIWVYGNKKHNAAMAEKVQKIGIFDIGRSEHRDYQVGLNGGGGGLFWVCEASFTHWLLQRYPNQKLECLNRGQW